MPFFKIETNQQLNDTNTQNILKKSSEFISDMLGKPEKYVMVSIETNNQMMFGGDPQPAAFVSLKSIELLEEKCTAFSDQICKFIFDEIGVPADRVFIDFIDIQRNMFGWNHKTF